MRPRDRPPTPSRFPHALKDIFGQTLGREQRLTFKVGKAEPRLFGPDQIFVTLDPASKKPVFSVYAINYAKLPVKIYAVQPEDWKAFQTYMRNWQQTDQPSQMPGKLVFDETITLDIPDDTLSEVNIDLSPYLKNGFGHFIVIVQPPAGMFESQNDKWQRYSQTIHTWVQVTQIGVDAYTDYSDMIVWATDLKDGSPLAGVSIQPEKGGRTFTTGSDGTVRVAIPSGATYLVASRGADKAMLLHSPYIWDDTGWQPSSPSDSLRWYVFDDRKMYRPGEEVHIKGWLRQVGGQAERRCEPGRGRSHFGVVPAHRPAGQRHRQWAGGCQCPGRLRFCLHHPADGQPWLCPSFI